MVTLGIETTFSPHHSQDSEGLVNNVAAQAVFAARVVKETVLAVPTVRTEERAAGQTCTAHSSHQTLHERATTARWAPHLSPVQEDRLHQQFNHALAHERFGQCCDLATEHPWLIKAHPQALLLKEPGVPNGTVLYELVTDHVLKPADLLQLLATPQGRAALMIEDNGGITALHELARSERYDFHDVLKTVTLPEEAFRQTSRAGNTLLHFACTGFRIRNCQMLMERCPESLMAVNNKGSTPFDYVISSSKLSCEDKQAFYEQAIAVQGFVDSLIRVQHQISTTVAMERQIQKLIKKKAIPSIPVSIDRSAVELQNAPQIDSLTAALSALNLMASGESQGARGHDDTIKERLDLASTVGSGNMMLEQAARRLVAGLGCVGVYGRFTCFEGERKGKLWSLGDENASLQLVMQLVALGAPHIQFRLSPPSPHVNTHSQAARAAFDTVELREMQRVALHKLAILLPQSGFEPEDGLPQTIILGNSHVHIIDFKHAVENEPQLELSFIPATLRGFRTTVNTPRHYIVIHPYRFFSCTQSVHMDIAPSTNRPARTVPACPTENTQGSFMVNNRALLNLPPNSLLPEKTVSHPETFKTQGSERQWLDQLLTATLAGTSKQAEQLSAICSLCRAEKIHTGIIYGLHHAALNEQKGRVILCRWIASQQSRRRPTLLFVHRSRMPLGSKNALNSMKIAVIGLGKENVQAWLSSVRHDTVNKETGEQQGTVTICLIPDLPKPVFHHLIDTSDLPALAEGANITSYLLETGHPYLSVLPDGRTPVPCEMGYPLEALKSAALSHIIGLTPEQINLLERLHTFVQGEKFDEALHYLQLNREALASLPYLHAPSSPLDDMGLNKVTVVGLLRKAADGRLGVIEKQALLAATDPALKAISAYTEACLDENSITRDHFSLQKQHVNQAFNDTVLMALARFIQLKKIDL